MKKFATVGKLFFTLTIAASSKKTVPTTEESTTSTTPTETKTAAAPKPIIKTPTPKSIVVNDAAAKTSANGRRYYDLEGKRYWRNKKDGKYYLYYKGMFDNKDFQ